MPKRILKAARIPTAINLKASTAEIQASSSALEYQKRAMRWVNGLQDHPAAQEELTIRVGAISLNIFDALKSELKAKGGQALANVEVARALKTHPPPQVS